MNNNMNKIVMIGILVLVVLSLGGFAISRSMRSTGVRASTQNSGSTMSQGSQNGSTVQVTPNGFQPMNITIKVGTTVAWTNNSGKDVSINSDNHPTHLLYPLLNLGRVSDGGQVSLTFNTPGTYGYHNHLNPSQTGTITVQ
jgi:plastocyanin